MNGRNLFKRLLFLPLWLTGILVSVSAAGLVFVFTRGKEQSLLAYAVYAVSFYSLCAATLYCVFRLPKRYRTLKQKLHSSPFGNRCLTDREYRTRLSLSVSLAVSAVYIGLHVWSWHRFHSWWFVLLAGYYGIMAVVRFLLARYVRRPKIGADLLREWKRARICACILLLINLSLSGAVLMILYQSKGYDYPGVMIYVMALYTFYATAHAVAELVRYRKLGSPVMTTAKIVSLSGALVSLLTLETAMFAQFGGEMALEHQKIFIILTGAGVSLTVVTLSVLLIVSANREIRREKYGK